MLKQMDKLEVVSEEKVLLLPAPQVNEFTVEGIKFKSINAVPNDAMSMVVQLIAINEGELPIPRYVFERLGRGHCGGTWAISKDLVLKINEIDNRADIDLERFVDGECLEDLQGLPLVPKLYAYSYDKQYMIVERIHGMQVGQCEYDMNNFTAQLGASIVPKFWNWKKWIDKACEFNRGCLQRGWIPNDLHGENVMIDKAGNLTVVDYGLFKKIGKHDEISRWNFDREYDRIASTIRLIARQLKSATRQETDSYQLENPLTYEEFKPTTEKKIEKEAKAVVANHKDSILKLLGITESTSSMNEIEAHEDMEKQPLDFIKLLDAPVIKWDDVCINEHANKSYLSKTMLSRRFLGARQWQPAPLVLPLLKGANREQRSAPQGVELQEQDEEVASIPHGDFKLDAPLFGKPVLLGCDFGKAHEGFIALGQKIVKQWRGKL